MCMWGFIEDERGAVAVDWIALTAGIIILGLATVYKIFDGGVAPAMDVTIEAAGKAGDSLESAPDLSTIFQQEP